MKFKIGLTAVLMLGTVTSGHAQQTQSDSPASTNAVPAAEMKFKVAGYKIDGNTVLSPEKFDFLTNYTARP